MIKRSAFALSFVILACFTGTAYSKTQHVKVQAGKTQVIGFFGVRDRTTCSYLKMEDFKIKKAPENGKVHVARHSQIIPNGKCKGNKFHGFVFTYRGNGKKDKLQIDVIGARYSDYIGRKVWVRKFKINH